MEPVFRHDCDRCIFLGHFEGRDLYYCHHGIPTVIARHSDEGPDYQSGMAFAETNHYLKEAKFRASVYLKGVKDGNANTTLKADNSI